MTVLLAALAYHRARRETWLGGWLAGPVSIITALVAGSYGVSGLPNLVGVDSFARDPRALLVDAAVALLAAAVVAGAVWPVLAHVAAFRGRPITVADLRDWAQTQRLHAGGGAAAGAAAAWIVLGPLLCAAGAVLGALATAVVEHLRGPAIPAARPEHRRPPEPRRASPPSNGASPPSNGASPPSPSPQHSSWPTDPKTCQPPPHPSSPPPSSAPPHIPPPCAHPPRDGTQMRRTRMITAWHTAERLHRSKDRQAHTVSGPIRRLIHPHETNTRPQPTRNTNADSTDLFNLLRLTVCNLRCIPTGLVS